MNNQKEFNATIDKLEEMPSFSMDQSDHNRLLLSAIVSIAISLKRIADGLEIEGPIDHDLNIKWSKDNG